jgi:S-DNA-T family DNA segregation ATPase FtsK/SpoIIIE
MNRSNSTQKKKPKSTKPLLRIVNKGNDKPGMGWISWISRFRYNYAHFGGGIAGVIIAMIMLLTLLGLFGWTRGTLITNWVFLIGKLFGLGKYLVVFTLAILSFMAFTWQSRFVMKKIRLGRVLALEGAGFSFLALLGLLSGNSIEMAEAGRSGGIVGWGIGNIISRFLPLPFSAILFVIVIFLGVFFGTGLATFVGKLLEEWLLSSPINKPAIIQGESVVNQSELANAGDRTKAKPRFEEKNPVRSVETITNPRDSQLPPYDLLVDEHSIRPDEIQIQETAALIVKTLAEFGIPARVIGFRVGPTVTQYAIEPGFVEKTSPDGNPMMVKIRVSQISALARDLALALSAERLRIEAPVPGQTFVGIEVPNSKGSIVNLRPLLMSESYRKMQSPLIMALGRDVSGSPVLADLARMPHILIAGATGSGKSICIASIITSLIMNNSENELRIVMMDPKKVELLRFNGIPHLLGEVETEIERMLASLRWALVEMDHRYRLLESARVRDLDTYNQRAKRRNQPTLPRIVIFIDELADLMMSAPDQTEHSLVRLAQMARATGIHLVLATQRPSVNVVTGLIKANFPARISFTVATSIDSRVILDVNGAETLLGHGDMLFLNPETGTPLRAQGTMISDVEINKVVTHWKNASRILIKEKPPWEDLVDTDDNSDDLMQKAVELVKTSRHASASLLQRKLRIGYPRAARLLDELENLGVVGPSQGGGREREVIISSDEGDEVNVDDDETV